MQLYQNNLNESTTCYLRNIPTKFYIKFYYILEFALHKNKYFKKNDYFKIKSNKFTEESTQHKILNKYKLFFKLCLLKNVLKIFLLFCNNFKIKSSFYCLAKILIRCTNNSKLKIKNSKLSTNNSKLKIKNYLFGNFVRSYPYNFYKIMPVVLPTLIIVGALFLLQNNTFYVYLNV